MVIPLKPLIAICGTTGVGKSKLAIEVALHLTKRSCTDSSQEGWRGAKIINADSMQVYQGMDLITNKIPKDEMQGIEHALMGFKSPGEQYVVGQWVQDAVRVIDEAHKSRQIPIVVGGTSYWIQHLIFPGRLSKSESTAFASRSATASPSSCSTSESAPLSPPLRESLASLPTPLQELWTNLPDAPPSASTDPKGAMDLHNLLAGLDPDIASRWHWCDTRKVYRSLSIVKETGRRPSELISEQSGQDVPPRYQTLCFWLYADPAVLNPRLDERVDEMIKQGALDELRDLHRLAHNGAQDGDYTLGVYQSIGYREFHSYLSLPPSEQTTQAFTQASEAMKLSTRQYAKRQIQWIRNKLLPAAYAQKGMVSAYLLDATKLGNEWDENVRSQGVEITQGFLKGEQCPDPLSLSATAKQMLDIPTRSTEYVHHSLDCPALPLLPRLYQHTTSPSPSTILLARRKRICSTCSVDPTRPVMIEEGAEWEAHVRTKVHRRLGSKGRREAEARGMQEVKREERRRVREAKAALNVEGREEDDGVRTEKVSLN